MDVSSMWQIILLILLLFGSAFFSSSETALMSLSKIRMRHMLAQGVKGAKRVHEITSNPHKMLSSILVGNNIVNIAASAIATSLAIRYFGSKGVVIATVSMTLLVLIFGEITPKSLAAQNPERVSIRVSSPIHVCMIVLGPITVAVNALTNFLVRMLGGSSEGKKPHFTEEEIKTMINVSHEEGVLEVEEREMIHNIFKFTDAQVKAVMIPRTDVFFVSYASSYGEVIDLFRKGKHSRMPVYKDSLDDIVGILHVKDLFFLEDRSTFNMEEVMKKPHFSYEFKGTLELFDEMRKNRIPMSVVLDEYGGTVGIITTEDLVEEIVGEIEDDYDDVIQQIHVVKNDEFIVDGSTKISQINEGLGLDIVSEEYATIGGFVLGEIGRLPEEQEVVVYDEVTFVVEKIEKNRIVKLRIYLTKIGEGIKIASLYPRVH